MRYTPMLNVRFVVVLLLLLLLFLLFSLPLLLVVCTLSIQPNDSLSKYISRASPARGDTFVSISFHRLICYKITFSCLINFYALKHTHSYTHSLSRSHTNRRLQ